MRPLLPLLTLFALALGTTHAQTLPPNPAFDQPVSIASGGSIDLRFGLELLGQTIGYTVIAKGIDGEPLEHDLAAPRPFREAWNLLARLHDLEYVVENDLIVVGKTGTLTAFIPQPEEAPLVDRTYAVANPEEIAEVLRARFPLGNVTAIPAASTILVTVKPNEHPIAVELINDLDPRITATKDANVVTTLTRIYNTQGDPNELVALLQTALPEASITAVSNLGAISITGTEAHHREALEQLTVLADLQAAAKPVRRTYSVNNAEATALAEGVTGALEAQGITGTVSADERTNKLTIVAPLEGHDIAAGILRDLDAREKQVRIRARIQEISTNELDRLGIDLSSGVGTLAGSFGANGLSMVFNPLNLITALTINATLDTLQEQSLARSIDDANILALNNTTATLNSGGSIELIIGSGDSAQIRTVEFGTNLAVTPRISDDRFITLEIEVGLSDFEGELNANQGLQLSDKSIVTTVQIEDGDVVILGGLLKEGISVAESGTPVLKNLPVIGALFRHTSTRVEESELVIVLEANID